MKSPKSPKIFKEIVILLIILFTSCSDDTNNESLNDMDTTTSSKSTTNDPNFETNLVSLLHNNINVSDFEASKTFYQLLGFTILLDIDVDVSDPDEAQGLNLPPYTLKAAPMILTDGFLLDLIQYTSPFNDEAPHKKGNSLGLATLSLKTDDLVSDIAVFKANDIKFKILTYKRTTTNNRTTYTPTKIRFTDPDGTIILLTEEFENKGLNSSGQTYIHGLYTTNINVSDLRTAIQFYKKVGFEVLSINKYKRIANIAMPDGRDITLTKSNSNNQPYEDLNHLGIARMAIITTDIDADILRLKSNSIETYTPEAITPAGELATFRYVVFEDPDGTAVQLVEYF